MKPAKGMLVTMILCSVIVSEMHPAFSDGPVVIAVVLSRDIAPYRDALEGFEDQLKREGRPYRLQSFNIEAYSHDPASLIDRIRSKKPSLVLTLGSSATEFVAEQVDEIPIVFSMVLPSPAGAKERQPWDGRGNVTGATMQIPLGVQFQKIREVLPEARNVGVLYDPLVSGPLIEQALSIAGAEGLALIPLEVTSEADIVDQMRTLDGRIDVLWSVADSTVFTPQGLRHILLSTLRDRIPFVGLSPAFVKAGALLALSCDYGDVGRQSGEMAVKILDGERPGAIPAAVPREVNFSVNLNTAREIRVAITDEIREAAASLF